MPRVRKLLPCALAACAIATGCAPAEEEQPSSPAAAATADSGAGEVVPVEPLPAIDLAETAWRVEASDGTVYTTYIDADGSYRDHREGEPWRTGSWDQVADRRVCFEPDPVEQQALIGDCWRLGEQDAEGTVRATGDGEQVIELRRVTYREPEPDAG